MLNILLSITNSFASLDEMYIWGTTTPSGIFVVKILPALLAGIVSRLLSWEFFGAIDIFLKEKYSKAFKRLALLFGFSLNILASIGLTLLLANGDDRNTMIFWGTVYGCISVVLQLIWEILIWKVIKVKLKKKYNINIDKDF